MEKQLQEICIDYAIWLGYNCKIWADCYILKSEVEAKEQNMFYIDSGSDMQKLYEHYLKGKK